ncbi:patatin family protein [Halosquirtibacter laminarini]|uniref:Patatin family protein n=1 Tax=Halosquirtibacter laminarini TaxID=3374600 RepID=A0AC61NPG2_9BACT|nr:patatin family protein [Prolixibacteraceae bacterium]
MKNSKTALVLEGGGSRGMYTAGILELFLEHNIYLDATYAISSGALYGISYISKQPGRNIEVNSYCGDSRYCGVKHLIKSKSYISWDFLLSELPFNLLPLDFKTIEQSPNFFVGTSNCITGKADFYKINDLKPKEVATLLQASGSLPVISPMVDYNNNNYLDGGLADSIPF